MDLTLWGLFFTVVGTHFLALLSPGPDFILLVKSAVKYGAKTSLGVVTGIACAHAGYIFLCLIGVGSILSSSLLLLTLMKTLGGLFLMYLAIQALLSKRSDYIALSLDNINENKAQTTWLKEFIIGFLTAFLNPKNLLFYLSLFTLVLNEHVSMSFKIWLGIWMTLLVFSWDAFIIYFLSMPKVRGRFVKFSYYIDKLTGVILGGMGLSVIKSTLVTLMPKS